MSERRDYFRINLSASVVFKCVQKEELCNQNIYTLFDDGHLIKIHTEINQLEQETSSLLQQIKEKDRLLGEYLHANNRKINLLSELCINNQKDNRKPKQTISLSEAGLSFYSDSLLDIKQHLALYLKFPSTAAPSLLYAEVTRCEPAHDKGYQITAEFHYTAGIERRQINQEMMRAQLELKRKENHKQ